LYERAKPRIINAYIKVFGEAWDAMSKEIMGLFF
jgi:hypothetical protein